MEVFDGFHLKNTGFANSKIFYNDPKSHLERKKYD